MEEIEAVSTQKSLNFYQVMHKNGPLAKKEWEI